MLRFRRLLARADAHSRRSLSSALPQITMPFNAVRVDLADLVAGEVDVAEFERSLSASLELWQTDGTSAVWLSAPEDAGALVAVAARHGFRYHHAEAGGAMLNRWLPEGESRIPPFATHKVGVAGLVLNEFDEVLVIREARGVDGGATGFGRGWKLPGGLADLGEELAVTAAREVREETGVRADFKGVVGFRHQHDTVFGRSDLYFVCEMTPQEAGRAELSMDTQELADCKWMPLAEYASVAESQMNTVLARVAMDGLGSSADRCAAGGGGGGSSTAGAVAAARCSALVAQELLVKKGGSRGGVLYRPYGPQLDEDAIGGVQVPTPRALATQCARLLLARGENVSLAESSSGGAAASELVAVEGASQFFGDSVVCYSKASKQRVLGLSEDEQSAARSATEEHALMLARAVREANGTAWGVGETGVAGPGPNGRGVPPGCCCVAIAGPGGISAVRTLPNTECTERSHNMARFGHGALQLLAEILENEKEA